MRLNKKEEKKSNKVVTQQTVDAVHTHTHTHTHTGNNLNKRKRRIVCIVSISLIVLILGIIAYSENIKPIGIIEDVKRALGEITESSNTVTQSNVTTIDVTGITLGKETQHEHIYKTMYDEETHWEECKYCGEIRNEKAHSYTTTWASGKESCEKNNYYTKTCTCGYSFTGHKPCVWNGKTYQETVFAHAKICSVCKGQISFFYYLNTYNSGTLHDWDNDIQTSYRYDEMKTERCHKSNGTIINCNNLGTCVKCKTVYSSAKHFLITDEDNTIKCRECGKNFGTCTNTITVSSTAPATYTVTSKISFANGASFLSTGEMRELGTTWQTNTQTITSGKVGNVNVTLKTVGKFKSTWKSEYSNYITAQVKINGIECVYRLLTHTPFYPDPVKPTISDISVGSSSSWSKYRTINITGTENYCNTVKIKILDDENNEIYSGETTVNNGNYSISCTPDLEAGIEGRTFKTIVTDACENSIEKEFTISKIDSIVPEITSSDKVNENWTKEKNITFTAVDHGAGNIQIAFNNISDYSLASKNGTEYSREYKLIGDVYTPRDANVYYRDELGNVSTKKVTINKLDNTAPTITGASFSNNKLNINAHDRHQTEGEGSGVAKYRFITSTGKLANPKITEENSIEVLVNENIIIPEIYKVKYVYVVAEDLVGNISSVYEVEVPQLELTSKINLSGANGKGEIELDWSSYDISNKYFVIYRKQEDETAWETIVSLEQKFNGNKYTDNLADDKANPSTPIINIEGKQGNNNIEITALSEDNGAKYTYYIESYDTINVSLLNISNIISM